ncbi:SulP family inorganic anion transporter [Blastopirellula sp. JC732]|uniref:SulP family inorganic anion transporter n=1 Tax=Blastopirellula sediminis TaxID=2894196 RepID=A0A9X1SG43_9BACT|nr:SulP family inorganic anion transporter [Blastopirellula sediminis]MCC9608696.1 SulP family inorganic anion transporter [Blastopirellula sediminis]MCC9628527.1 SulP family inorganic anion transporter [Blastopirellula sediminis]
MSDQTKSSEFFRWPAIRNDIFPSIVVFLVALPLCLGIAIASGAPPAAGLISGIVGGLVVGFLAGSPLQVSGPAAGLTVIVYGLFEKYDIQLVMLTVVLAGLMQIAAGSLKLGQWFRAVSPAVVKGMLAGIGMLIFCSQFHIMIDDQPRKGLEVGGVHLEAGLANLLTIPQAIGRVFAFDESKSHHLAAGLGLLTIVVIVCWKMTPKKFQLVPGPLLGVLAATLISEFFDVPIRRLGESIPDSFLSSFVFPDLAIWGTAPFGAILASAAGLALVASAETLLCATAVDQMHDGQRTNYDRELLAQGVGNSVCGLIGGLPITGVIVRSAANVGAGGKSRWSAIMHGAWLLLFVAFLPFLLKQIPVACLAAVLVYTGYKLVNPASIRELARYGKSEVAIYFATMIMIVTTDLLIGVMTGIVLAACKLLYVFSHLEIKRVEDPSGENLTLYLIGTATFMRLPMLASELEKVPANSQLHINLERLSYIDHACLDLLMTWEKQHEATGGSLAIDWDGLAARFYERYGDKRRTESSGEAEDSRTAIKNTVGSK